MTSSSPTRAEPPPKRNSAHRHPPPREPRHHRRSPLLVLRVLRIPAPRDRLREDRRADEQERQQHGARDGPRDAAEREGAEDEHEPPLGLLEKEVRVAREAEQAGLQETRVGDAAGGLFGVLPLV